MKSTFVPRPASTEELRVALGELLNTQSKAVCPDRFALRIGVRIFETLQREESYGLSFKESECRRLRTLLDSDSATRSELCRVIAEGRGECEVEELQANLWVTTLDSLAIDQPAYKWGA